MPLLLVAPGAEDARTSTWGHVTSSLRDIYGDQVFAFDPDSAHTAGRNWDYQCRWLVKRLRPAAVILLNVDQATARLFHEEAVAKNTPLFSLQAPYLTQPGQASAEDSVSVPVLCNPTIFQGSRGAPALYDAVLGADATRERAHTIENLTDSGLTVHVCGNGWSEYPSFATNAFGSLPMVSLGDFLRKGTVAVVSDSASPTSALHVLEAVSAGVPAIVDDAVTIPDAARSLVTICSGHEIAKAVQAGTQATAAVLPMELTWGHYWQTLDLPSPDSYRAHGVRVTKEGPKVSFCTSVYDTEQYVGLAIESMLDQTEKDFELLVCDDGSHDNSKSVIKKYAGDPRVRFVEQENIGQTGRFDLIWRTLWREGRGDFLAILGSDDIAMPNKLEQAMRAFDADPQLGILHTAGYRMDQDGNTLPPIWHLPFSYDDSSILRTLMWGNVIAHPSSVIRKSEFARLGELEEGFAADYHFWLKAAGHTRFRFLPQMGLKYRVHEGSASTSIEGVVVSANEAARLVASEMKRHTILDVYPFAADGGDDGLAAAFVDVGNRLLRFEPLRDLAIDQYRSALSLSKRAEDQLTDWLSTLESGVDLATLSASASLPDALALSAAPFQIPEERLDSIRAWDGTTMRTRRILLRLDPADVRVAAVVLQEFLTLFAQHDPIELVIPTLQLSEGDVLASIIPLIPAGVDLDSCAPMTIEEVDDLALMPAERFITAFGGEVATFDAGVIRATMHAVKRVIDENAPVWSNG